MNYLDECILLRRSVRRFTEQDIEKEKINRILLAGMAAPSAFAKMPWSFYVIDDTEDQAQIAKMSKYSSPAKTAKLLIVPCLQTDEEFVDNNGTRWGALDLAACCENMLLQTVEENLAGVWLGFYPDVERVNRLSLFLGCDDKTVPFAVLAIGYPAKRQSKKRKAELQKKLEKKVKYLSKEKEIIYAIAMGIEDDNSELVNAAREKISEAAKRKGKLMWDYIDNDDQLEGVKRRQTPILIYGVDTVLMERMYFDMAAKFKKIK